LVFFTLDQDIAQNRHCGFRTHDIEDLREAICEMVAVDFEFHEGGSEWTLCAGFGNFNERI
jgi:hypothetical protein